MIQMIEITKNADRARNVRIFTCNACSAKLCVSECQAGNSIDIVAMCNCTKHQVENEAFACQFEPRDVRS